MTNKEILAKIRKYFIEEKQPKGVNATGVCRYSAPCAIGLLLLPNLAAKIDESGSADSISDVYDNFPEVAEIFEDNDLPFLCSLQNAHDAHYDDYEDWHDGFATELTELAVAWT